MSELSAGLVENAPGPARDVTAQAVQLAAIARGRADLTAGRFIDIKVIDDWIESVGTPVELDSPLKHSLIVLSSAVGRQVNLTAQAGNDIIEIGWRLASAGSGELARAVLKAISLAIKNIVFTPLGSPLSSDIGLRERTAAGCTIVYDVEVVNGIGPCAGDVTVLCICALHSSEGISG